MKSLRPQQARGLVALSGVILVVFALACVGGGGGGSSAGLPASISVSSSLSTVLVNPTSVASDGVALATITVTVLDAAGQPLSGQTVQVAASGSGNTLTQPASLTNANGQAIGTLASTVAEAKTITVTVNPATAAVVLASNPVITFSAGAQNAVKLAFVVQPSNVAPGAAISPAITVAIQDSAGATVSGATNAVTMAIGNNPGGAGLSGTTTVNAVSGVATFSDLAIGGTGNGYTLIATAAGLSTAVSAGFNVATGGGTPTPTKLAFLAEPTSTAPGATISPPVRVAVQDSAGATVTGSSALVALTIANNAGPGTMSGTLQVAASNGIAAFPDLSINNAGTGYTLSAASSGLTSATSASFNVAAAGAATKLAFTVEPSNTAVGAAISPAVVVAVQDASGITTPGSSALITLAIGTNPSAGTLSGTLQVAATNGLATFPDLSINNAGTAYTLSATAAGLTAATSAAFNITTGGGGAATQLAFSVEPSNAAAGTAIAPAIQVEVRDSAGALAPTATDAITLVIGTDPSGGAAALLGTLTKSAVAGVATFSDIAIDTAGAGYTLAASATGLTTATSASFDITQNTVPTGPLPVNAAALATQYPILSWTGVPSATGYDVYLDAGTNPPTTKVATAQAGTTLVLGSLPLAGTMQHFWRVDVIVGTNTTAGTVWDFSTGGESPATRPQTPSPADGSTGAILTPLLSWDAVTGATSYDVLLDTGSGLTVVSAGQTGTTWQPSTALVASTAHQWRVDTRHPDWKSLGKTWTFTTGNPQSAAVQPSPADRVNDIWLESAGVVYAVTENGGINGLSGGFWSNRNSGVTVNLNGVWQAQVQLFGIPIGNAYIAVGDGATVLYSQTASAGSWSAQPAPGVTANLNDLWGKSPADTVMVCGDGGTMVQVSFGGGGVPTLGAVSVPQAGPTTEDLLGIWGTSQSDMWVVGRNAFTSRWDGANWLAETNLVTNHGATGDLYGVWQASPGEIYVCGTDQIWYSNTQGATWTKQWAGVGGGVTQTFRKIWGWSPPSGDEVWAVGDATDGVSTWSVLYHYTVPTGVWVPDTHPQIDGLSALMGTGGSEVYAGGALGHIMLWDGLKWTSSAAPSVSQLNDLWGPDENTIFAVGAGGDIIGFASGLWAAQTSGVTTDLLDVEGAAANDVYAAGANRVVLHFDGAQWTPESLPATSTVTFRSVSVNATGEVLVCGDSGTLLRKSGGSWNVETSGVTTDLLAVAWVDTGVAVCVGAGGTILRYSGGSWSAEQSGTTANLTAVAGTSAGDVHAGGAGGVAVHWNGTAWSSVASGITDEISDMEAPAAGQTYAAGPNSAQNGVAFLLENTGGGWANIQPITASSNPLGIWAPNATTVYACGRGGTVWKFTK